MNQNIEGLHLKTCTVNTESGSSALSDGQEEVKTGQRRYHSLLKPDLSSLLSSALMRCS